MSHLAHTSAFVCVNVQFRVNVFPVDSQLRATEFCAGELSFAVHELCVKGKGNC